jgi:hypothetical protein
MVASQVMTSRHLIVSLGFIAILLPLWAFADQTIAHHFSLRRLDDQNQQSSTAAKDDIVLISHDDGYDGDAHTEKFNYTYKNIGTKAIKVAITVKAQHNSSDKTDAASHPFRTDTFEFTLAPGEEHAVSETWSIEKPANEGDPEMQYADDDHPDLLQATYCGN